MNERKLLQALAQSRKAYDSISGIMSKDDMSDQAALLYEVISDFYSKDSKAKSVDMDIISSRLERKYPKHADMLFSIIDTDEDISIDNIIEEAISVKKENIGLKLASALMGGSKSAVANLIEEYQSCSTEALREAEEVCIAVPLSEVVESFKQDNLIKVYPKSLNEAVGGGVVKQTHILIFARPEVGKSMFALNMAAGFCRDGHTVLYVGNEDPKDSMLMRIITRMTGMSKLDILKDVDTATELAMEKGYDRFILASLDGGTIDRIESLIRKHEPDCLIIDQVRHLEFRGVTGELEQLTRAGKAIRTLTKKYDLVTVSVMQAGESAEGKLVLSKEDVYMSKTSLPGDADIQIGIGMNKEYERTGRRMLSIVKNKANNNHTAIPVAVFPQLSKVISI